MSPVTPHRSPRRSPRNHPPNTPTPSITKTPTPKKPKLTPPTPPSILSPLQTTPDLLSPTISLLIIGINPGLESSRLQHHYAGKNNHFWPCLFHSHLVPEQLSHLDDHRCPHEFGIGLINIIQRPSASSSELSKQEFITGGQKLCEKIIATKPKVVLFNGKCVYEGFVGRKSIPKPTFTYGLQSREDILRVMGVNADSVNRVLEVGVKFVVVPCTSGRVASYQFEEKLGFFKVVKGLLDLEMGKKEEEEGSEEVKDVKNEQKD